MFEILVAIVTGFLGGFFTALVFVRPPPPPPPANKERPRDIYKGEGWDEFSGRQWPRDLSWMEEEGG